MILHSESKEQQINTGIKELKLGRGRKIKKREWQAMGTLIL
jgi:hypothetical protein